MKSVKIRLFALLLLTLTNHFSTNAQFIFEYGDLRNNSVKLIKSVKYAYIENDKADTVVKQTIKYYYSDKILPDSSIVINNESGIKTIIKYTYNELNHIIEKGYFTNDSLLEKIKYTRHRNKIVERKFTFKKDGSFGHCCTTTDINKTDYLTITKEKYFWKKRNYKYFYLAGSNRIWKYYKDKYDFIYFETIQTDDSKGKTLIYREKVNNVMTTEFAVNESTKKIIERHNTFLDNYGNRIKSELIVDGKLVSTVLWLIEY